MRYTGRCVNRSIPSLRQHSIPEPVTGGLIASVALTAIQLAGGLASPWSLLAGRVRAAQH